MGFLFLQDGDINETNVGSICDRYLVSTEKSSTLISIKLKI